jgi:hypothetical protein
MLGALVACALVAGCAGGPTRTHTGGQAATQAGSGEVNADVRDVLSMLARAHSQKTELAFYTSTPLRPVDPPFKAFFSNMGQVQGDLLRQLKKWASERKVDLSFHYSNDIEGRAQKFMEDRQEKAARGDDKEAFERDMLMNMYTDYEWQISLITETLPVVKDAELREYLQNSLRAHEAGSREIRGLLSKYKFVP